MINVRSSDQGPYWFTPAWFGLCFLVALGFLAPSLRGQATEAKTNAPAPSTATQSKSEPEPSAASASTTNRLSAVDYFKEHFFPYEPFYFIAGPDSPNAKFQLSFKYRILNSQGPLASRAPALTGLHLAYTQTSLWDWNRPSAPFLDSSYKPEFLYSLERLNGRHGPDWLRLDLQSGFQHESNGQAGDSSRSLNILYLKPTVRFGQEDGLFFSLGPRAWVYLGDLSDTDLPQYRGYADLRAVTGWANGLQLSSFLRVGEEGNRGSLQLDLTYPMSRLFTRIFSLYLHAQLFTGYGESLLYYRDRSTSFRAGFSLFR